MPLANVDTTGGTTPVSIVAAVSAVTWQIKGMSLTASGATPGKVVVKAGTTVVYTLSSPGSIDVAPGEYELPPASAANTAITVTPSDAGIQVSGVIQYTRVLS